MFQYYTFLNYVNFVYVELSSVVITVTELLTSAAQRLVAHSSLQNSLNSRMLVDCFTMGLIAVVIASTLHG